MENGEHSGLTGRNLGFNGRGSLVVPAARKSSRAFFRIVRPTIQIFYTPGTLAARLHNGFAAFAAETAVLPV